MGTVKELSSHIRHRNSHWYRWCGNGAIGRVANISTPLTLNGDKPFSDADALITIGAGALSQGKGAVVTGGISIGGAYVGRTIKGDYLTNAMFGTKIDLLTIYQRVVITVCSGLSGDINSALANAIPV